jgi:putative FmdB family regulatory protein
MPLYEYSCRDCATEFETLVFSEAEPVECPKCDGKRIEKKLSLPARPAGKESEPRASASGAEVEASAWASAPLRLRLGCQDDRPPCGPGCCRL